MGPKPLSSSLTITLATNAVVTNMKKIVRTNMVRLIAPGLLTLTLPPLPICTFSETTAPNVSRKNRMLTNQKTGLRS